MMDSKARTLTQVGSVIWVSFLSAGLASMLFFSTFDPAQISLLATFPMEISRSGGYTVGFLLFWLLLMINSAAVVWLSQRDPNRNEV